MLCGLQTECGLFCIYCRYADIYTSRVSNFLHYTPFMYFQSQEQVNLWHFAIVVFICIQAMKHVNFLSLAED